ncbi:hypothetical protein [Parasitella parasitica]|uniref:EF-hand domain-containing protein n=1 Tax=Parasitella parasitica TaxID=35722 RepID=A0A0B7N9Z7_9FUNG|nr:hypothetical protein [Parasitella parasitica]
MDDDGDGVITTFDLEEHWQDQEKKLYEMIDGYSEDAIRFDDLICQLLVINSRAIIMNYSRTLDYHRNDLIRPQIPGQFRLSDLKRNGIIAERFFDTFLNTEKFQIHDTHQGLIRTFQQLEREKKKQYGLERQRLLELRQAFLISEGCSVEQQGALPLHLEQPEEPFSLGAWCDYAEQEYDLLLLNEQDSNEYNADDSDWSPEQQQQHPHPTAVDSDDSDDEDELELESPRNSNDELDESDSTSSTPTTPVMQHVHDHKQPSLQQQNWDLASY